MPVFKVNVKYLYLLVVDPQGEVNGMLRLSGAYLSHNPNSISFPFPIPISILKQQFSAICLCYVLGQFSLCLFCFGIISFMELKNFVYYLCPLLSLLSFWVFCKLDCFILSLRSLKLCLYFLVFYLSIFYFRYLLFLCLYSY